MNYNPQQPPVLYHAPPQVPPPPYYTASQVGFFPHTASPQYLSGQSLRINRFPTQLVGGIAPIARQLCRYCGIKLQIPGYEYCSITCGQAARNAAGYCHANNHLVGTQFQSRRNAVFPSHTGTGCKIPGCQAPRHVSRNGTTSSYCSDPICERVRGNICVVCLQSPDTAGSLFCMSCQQKMKQVTETKIFEIPFGHATYRNVVDQFNSAWKHNNIQRPTVRHIYKIIITQSSLRQFDQYRAQIEICGRFVSKGRPAGNEQRRWHGTTRNCTLGDNGHNKLCLSTKCSLCSIIRHSFDLNLFAKKTGWGRFGRGIYSSSVSSKSNDYSHNACQSRFKALLLNKVIVGNGIKMHQDNTTLVAPPYPYDSVLAEPGVSLNYDELVVYKNEAIRPSYLVIYDDT